MGLNEMLLQSVHIKHPPNVISNAIMKIELPSHPNKTYKPYPNKVNKPKKPINAKTIPIMFNSLISLFFECLILYSLFSEQLGKSYNEPST